MIMKGVYSTQIHAKRNAKAVQRKSRSRKAYCVSFFNIYIGIYILFISIYCYVTFITDI